RFDFEVNDSNYVIKVRSGGPDKQFSTDERYPGDDFIIWTSTIDYFADRRARIETALTQDLKSKTDFLKTIWSCARLCEIQKYRLKVFAIRGTSRTTPPSKLSRFMRTVSALRTEQITENPRCPGPKPLLLLRWSRSSICEA